MAGAVLALVIKEFGVLLKDPKSRFVLIGPPIIQMLVFGYAVTYDLDDVPVAIYDEDNSAASRRLLAGFRNARAFREVLTITRQDQIAPAIDRRKALAVLHVGPTFARDLLSGRTAQLQVVLDGRNSNTAMVVLNYTRDVLLEFNVRWAAEHGGPRLPARLEARAWNNPNLLSRWFIVPGIVAMLTLVVTTLVTAMSVARERENGTFDQLLVTPLTPLGILLGKALPGLVIGLTEATGIVLFAVFWFGVPFRGSLVSLYAGLVLFLAAVIGMGLMISSLSATMQQALLGTFLFLTPAVILSGFTTPIENMPSVVQHLTRVNPMRYFLVIVRGVFVEAKPLGLLVHQLWPMALIAAATLLLAAWLFRHRSY